MLFRWRRKSPAAAAAAAITISCRQSKADFRNRRCSKSHRLRLLFATSVRSSRLSRRSLFLRKCISLQTICRTWAIPRLRRFLLLLHRMERARGAVLAPDLAEASEWVTDLGSARAAAEELAEAYSKLVVEYPLRRRFRRLIPNTQRKHETPRPREPAFSG